MSRSNPLIHQDRQLRQPAGTLKISVWILPDIVSFNMYSGWYEDISVKEKHEKEMAWIDAAVEKEKPVIVSEFGAAAIYGFRDRGHCKWSEERQADVIRENLEVYKEDNRLTGTFIWQFADCKVYRRRVVLYAGKMS